jgi:hypothetical protein
MRDLTPLLHLAGALALLAATPAFAQDQIGDSARVKVASIAPAPAPATDSFWHRLLPPVAKPAAAPRLGDPFDPSLRKPDQVIITPVAGGN